MSITLAQLEQETARRVGPYWRYFTDRQVPNTATFDFANFPELRTNADLDLVTNLWLLRRGECFDDPNEIVPMDVVERQRTVSTYDPPQGRVFPDRPWGVIPQAGEYVEFHHLNPSQELRPAVLAGLRRTYFADRYQLQGGIVTEADLTAALPWLLDSSNVISVQTAALYGARVADIPFAVFTQGAHVCIRLSGGVATAYPGLVITLLHPHVAFVNGVDSISGPTQDTDTLDVDLDYAAAAAHIEAWHLFPSRLQAAAAGGLQATQAMAAQEFTRQALIWAPRLPREIGFDEVFGLGRSHAPTVINVNPVYA